MKLPLFLTFMVLGFFSYAQESVYLSGFVNDSLSLEALPYVNISMRGKLHAATDHQGFFTLSAHAGDTIAFTRLGYQPYVLVLTQTSWDMRIFLAEMATMLNNVVIYDRFNIHGNTEIQKTLKDNARRDASPLNNFTMNPENQKGMVQTFGPGVNLTAPWDRWTKDAKEQRQLAIVLDESRRTKVYQEFIHSQVVQQYMMKSFQLDDDAFLKLKEQFIVNYPDARYLKTRQDIVDLMVAFLASEKK